MGKMWWFRKDWKWFFKLLQADLFQDQWDCSLFPSWTSKTISKEQAACLEKPFEEEEIKRAVFFLAEDKAPGLDGFSRNYTKIVGKSLIPIWKIYSKSFTQMGKFSWVLTQILSLSFLKNLGVNRIRDLRPISLIFAPYKIIAKVLSNRFIL